MAIGAASLKFSGDEEEWETYSLNVNKASSIIQEIDGENYPNYVCIRNPNGSNKRIMVNLAALGMLIAGTGLLVANAYDWQSRILTYISGLALGIGLEALLKFNLPPAAEAFWDDLLLITAAPVFQGLAQGEINTNPSWSVIWFSLFSSHLGAVSFSHLTNILSADAVQLGTQSQSSAVFFRPIFGDTKNFFSVLKFQTPFMVTCVGLLAFGIWKQDTLMINIGAFLGGREVGVLAIQQFLDWVERLRNEFDSRLQGDSAIPPSRGREMLTAAYKIVPYALPFIFGGIAASSKWPGYGAIGVAAGGGRIIKARFFEYGTTPEKEFQRLSNDYLCQIFLDALTPYPGYIFSASQREKVTARRRWIDITKGTIALSTVLAVNGWMAYWLTQFSDPYDRSQLITAGLTANLGYLASCGAVALCANGGHVLKNSIFFQINNLEDLLGPIYLAFFDQFINNQGSISSALPMWMLWSILLIVPLVLSSKKGKSDIIIAAVIYYMLSIFTAVKYTKGQLVG